MAAALTPTPTDGTAGAGGRHHRGRPLRVPGLRRRVVALWQGPLARTLVRLTHERPALCGALATSLLTLSAFFFANLPISSWPGDVGWLASVREVPGVLAAGIGVAVLASGLLALTWVGVGQRLLSRRGDPREVARYAAAWAAPLLVAPPLFSGDAWSYAAQGVVASRGLDPYVFGPNVLNGPITEAVSGIWMFTPAPYGPLGIVGGEIAGFVTNDPFLIVIWLRVLAMAGLVLLAFAVPHLARRSNADPAVAMWLTVANPAVIAHFVAGAHNDSLMVGLAALAVAMAVQGRWRVGILLVGLAASVKAPGVLAVIGVAGLGLGVRSTMRRRFLRLVGFGAAAVAVVLLVGVVTRLGTGWVRALGVPTIVEQALSLSTQLGRLAGGVLGLLGVPGSGEAVTVGRTIGLLASVVIVVVLALRTTRASAIRNTGLALLAVVVLGPVVYPWYLLWCLPFLASGRLGRRGLTALTLASVGLGVSAPLYETSIDAVSTTVSACVLVLMVAMATTSRLLTIVPDTALMGSPDAGEPEPSRAGTAA